ncbi:protein piccolo-like [Schistocerca gregaria]|uniref:protein piccolo-like n=1 Tax=Schistocerca gregaria TaxID=7010 RepID=UPI00211DC13F|nr:protein piccolo-like [Schistocerca gregaria]
MHINAASTTHGFSNLLVEKTSSIYLGLSLSHTEKPQHPEETHVNAQVHMHKERSRTGSRTVQATKVSQLQSLSVSCELPVKRFLLTRDPKDRSVGGNGLGMRIVGGKEIPHTGGELGAFVSRIYPGGVVDYLGTIKEGDQILEWNGVPLTGKTFEEVQRLISHTEGEIEIVVKSNI